ncbi:MAG: SLC13 family permease [Verrucomicrobiota bacterium]|nr:SLC13 family permease [Verrucomicrobiota bacterium]
MNLEQGIVLGVIAMTFGLFAWGKWRYDVVAVIALFSLVVGDVVLEKILRRGESNLIDPDHALDGFGHAAVITVAAVLVISRALRNSGVVDLIARRLMPLAKNQLLHITSLCVVAAVLSAFMNNVGALALLLPVALKTASEQNRSPTLILMPLAFASILGGMVTMIGTPPNIIISIFREEYLKNLAEKAATDSTVRDYLVSLGNPAGNFGMFDFSPVGGLVALMGVAFVALIGWRLIPKDAQKKSGTEELFALNEYITEVRVPEDCKFVGKTLGEVEKETGEKMMVFGFIRKDGKVISPNRNNLVRADARYLVKVDPLDLQVIMDESGLRLAKELRARMESIEGDDVTFAEVLVTPSSHLLGRTRAELRRRTSGSVVLMAVARQGQPMRKRLGDIVFRVGDVLLLQGNGDDLKEHVVNLHLLPLAERELQVGIFSKVSVAVGIFGAAIALSMFDVLPTTLAFLGAIIAYVFLGILPMRDLYRQIDWPVIVLLGAMIPVSGALQDTGLTDKIADFVSNHKGSLPAWGILAILMVLTMTLSDVINNAATALIMAPIGVGIALQMGASPDPFLMAVAVGASCAFLTPIGHQCNALILGPGGYRFGDYWRMGLPLEVLIVAGSVPLILYRFPLFPGT